MRRSLRLTPKLTLTLVVFAFVLLTIVGTLAYRSGRDSLEEATFSGLVSTAIEKEAGLETWIAEAQNQIANIAESPFIRERLVTLESETTATAQSAHGDIVGELKPLVGEDDIFDRLMILEPATGKIIASTNSDEEGTFKEDRPYFIEGQKAPYVQN